MSNRSLLQRVGSICVAWLITTGVMSTYAIPVYAYTSEELTTIYGEDYHGIHLNDDGSMTIVQTNKEAAPNVMIRGKTVGVQATNPNTGASVQIPTDPNNGLYQTNVDRRQLSNGYTYVTITTTIPADDAQHMLLQLGDINPGEGFQLDNIMSVTFDKGDTTSTAWDPITQQFVRDLSWIQANQNNPYFAQIMKLSGGDGAFGFNEGENFTNCIPWADKKSWLTNFKKVLANIDGQFVEMSGEEFEQWCKDQNIEIPEEKPEEHANANPIDPDINVIYRATTGGTNGRSQGNVEYYNDSRNYNEGGSHKGFADAFDTDGNGVGIIIPSSEKYITGITARTYAGTVAIGLGGDGHTFSYDKFDYDYTMFKYHWVPDRYENHTDAQNQIQTRFIPAHWELTDSKTWATKKGQIDHARGQTYRTANFVYIYDLDMYDFTRATTTNATFTSGSQTYEGTDPHVLYDINPEENGNGDPIGPVNAGDIAPGNFRSTANNNARPNYSVTVHPMSGALHIEGGYINNNAKQVGSFAPDPAAHLTWGDIQDVREEDRWVGSFSSGIYEPDDFPSRPGVPSGAKAAANRKVDKWVGDGKTESHEDYVPTRYYAEWSGDELILGYDGHVVVSPKHDDVHFTNDNWNDTFTAKGVLPSYLQGYVNDTQKAMDAYVLTVPDHETYETSPAFGGNIGSQQVIAANKKNGEYPTQFAGATYSHILAFSGSAPVALSSDTKGVYYQNNPIIVQTPVVAPVLVYDDPDNNKKPTEAGYAPINYTPNGMHNQDDRKTQLTYNTTDGSGIGRNDNLAQLRLDEGYWFKFDPLQHLSTQGYADWITGTPFDNNWSGDEIKFDKYVKAKYIHFPFAVCVYEKNNPTPTYYPLITDESDPRYWIKIYDQNDSTTKNNIIWTRFYIPSWAIEGAYNVTNEGAFKKGGIEYKVESINVTDDTGHYHDEDEAKHDLYNDNGDLSDATSDDHQLYVATYNIPVQVSGWVYDFQIIGTNNRDLYDRSISDELLGKWHDLLYPFAWNYEEKKAGTKNRLGGDSRYDGSEALYVRYTRSGEVAHTGDSVTDSILSRNTASPVGWLNKNTVVIDNTKSHKYQDAGTAPKGTEFAFSVRTMSNLWNDGDYVTATPSFWYQSDDGTKYTQNTGLYVYYNDYSGSDINSYIPFGSDRDKKLVRSMTLSNTMFNGSYFDEDLAATVLHPVYNAATAKFTNSYGESDTASLVSRYKLKETDGYTLSNIRLSSGLRIFSGNVDQLKANITADRNATKAVTEMYQIKPTDIDAVNSCVRPSMQTWYGSYLMPSELFASTMSPDEIRTYAEEHGGLASDDPNVWLKDGYLVVHFDIQTHNSTDPGKDLSYAGSNSGSANMWKNQNQDITAEVGNTFADTSDGHYGHKNITVNYGDIFVIDMGESIDDWFTANIWTIQ